MKFQKRILLFYTILACSIIFIFGGIYLFISINNHSDKVNNELKTVSEVKLQQLNHMFGNMASVTTYLLSDQEVLAALTVLADNNIEFENLQESKTEFYFKNEVALIRSRLNSHYMLSEFYKVILFNNHDVVISNSPKQNIKTGFTFEEYPWVDSIKNTRGNNVIIGVHDDDWDKSNNQQVISLIREIQGQNRGYVEVQLKKGRFDKQLKLENSNIDYIITTNDGDLVYSTDESLDFSMLRLKLTRKKNHIQTIKDSNGKKTVLMEQYSDEQGIGLITINHIDIFRQAIIEVFPLTFILLLVLFCLSFIYSYFASVYLAKPIRQLQQFIENTELENMNDDISEKIPNDEIESLYLSYKDTLSRLDESVVKEKKLSVLQLQAQFDLLQAQVNPHFIYNVLNVISGRGLTVDDEVICEMCSDLSEMLRYSTNTKEKFATIREEIDYLKLYLTLMKFRYRDKLRYDIQISHNIYEDILPKIVLQQIVENSIQHGYQHSSKAIEIEILGYQDDNGWYIKIRDHGIGITIQRRAKLYKEMEKIKAELSSSRRNVEMEIGGMGVVNTYARLYLLYGDRLLFEVQNRAEKGTETLITVRKESYVQGNDSR